jgi:hypothetical protein
LGGDTTAQTLAGVSGGVPLFGSIALDVTTKNRTAKTIHNGAGWRDRLVLLLIQGPLRPAFFLREIEKTPVDRSEAVVTASEGNKVLRINHMPAAAYLERIGLVRNGAYNTLFAIPFFLTTPEGEESVLACTAIDPGGALVFLTRVPEESLLRFGLQLNSFVLDSMAEMAASAREAARDRSLLLLFACFSRNVALEDPLREMALLREEMAASDLPFLFAYSGGEFCPRPPEAPRNFFLDHALVGCLL